MSKGNLGALIVGTAVGAALGGLAAVVGDYSRVGIAISSAIGAIGGSYVGSRYYKSAYQH